MPVERPQGERIAALEEITQNIKDDVTELKTDLDAHRADTARNFTNLSTGQQEIKDILLTKAAKNSVWKWIVEKMGWLFASLLALLGAFISGGYLHGHK